MKLKQIIWDVNGVNMKIKACFTKKTVIFGVVATIICIASFLWFTNTIGYQGTLNWHKEIRLATRALLLTACLPAIFLLINCLKDNKVTKILSYIMSCLFSIVWIAVFVAFTIIGSAKVDNSGMNLLHVEKGCPELKHIALASDPHWGASTANAEARIQILKNMEDGDYDLCLLTGDISDFGMITSYMDEAVKDIRTYMPTTLLRAIPGNHDALINGLPIFKRTFMDKDDKYNFRLDSGKVHILFLNMLWDSSELSKTQEKWLINQLEEIPQEETVIVISHCYVVSSGYYDPTAGRYWGDLQDVMKRLCPIFEKYHVDLHMSGHDHFFEYLEKDGVNYMVLGAMGGKLDSPITYNSPYSKWIDNTVFGYVDLVFTDNTIELSCLSKDNEVLFAKSIKTN